MAWIGSDSWACGWGRASFLETVAAAHTAWQRRLPREPEARLSALDSLFRETIAGRLSIDASVLLPHQIDSFDSEALEIRRALGQARFGGHMSSKLDAQVQTFIRRHA